MCCNTDGLFFCIMEVWKNIEGFENYQISSLGNIKSFKKYHGTNERILKPNLDSNGYCITRLSINGKYKTVTVHQLVAEAFLNHKKDGHNLVVNHKDFNRQNNNVENLEIITQRDNTNRKHIKSTSQYTGVSWDKISKKWRSQICVNRKVKNLGHFIYELEAHNAYEQALKDLPL